MGFCDEECFCLGVADFAVHLSAFADVLLPDGGGWQSGWLHGIVS